MKVLIAGILSASALAAQSGKTPAPVAQDALGGKSVPTVLTHSLGIPSNKTPAKGAKQTPRALSTYVPDTSALAATDPPPIAAPDAEPPQLAEEQPEAPPVPETPEAPAAAPAPPTYLIACKDRSIYTALAYWVEDDTLHYVTPQNTHNQASLSLIDVERSYKLSADQSVPFSLPGK